MDIRTIDHLHDDPPKSVIVYRHVGEPVPMPDVEPGVTVIVITYGNDEKEAA